MRAVHHCFSKLGRQCTIMLDKLPKGSYILATAEVSCKMGKNGKFDNFSRKKGRSICSIRLNDKIGNPKKMVRGTIEFATKADVTAYVSQNFILNTVTDRVRFVESLLDEVEGNVRLRKM